VNGDAQRPFRRFPFLARMTGAARVHVPTYEEVQLDQAANYQALLVVALGAAATGSGLGVGLGFLPQYVFLWGAGWLAWVLIIYLLGTTVFRTPGSTAEWGQLMRTAGFAQSPAVFQVLGIFPVVGTSAHILLVVVVTVWVLVTMSVAVRLSFNFSSAWRSAAVVAIGSLPQRFIELLLA